MARPFRLTEDDLRRIVDVAGEEPSIDLKAAMRWDRATNSAALTKNFLACSNTSGGGTIVIGINELAPGQFVRKGVSTNEADSFDTTKVAAWVNKQCEPSVTLACYRVSHNGKLFIVIQVAEFEDIPILCIKDYFDPQSTKRLLTAGALYVRTAKSESAPIRTSDDLRLLIGLAITKKQDELVGMIRSVLQGSAGKAFATPVDAYVSDELELRMALDVALGGHASDASWVIKCYPADFIEERWRESGELRGFLSKNLSSIGWPVFDRDIRTLNRGVLAAVGDRAVAMALSGICILRHSFFEERREFKDPWTPASHSPLGPGKWIEYKQTISRLQAMFMLLARYAHEFSPSESLVYEVYVDRLAGRRLVCEDSLLHISLLEQPCIVSRFIRRREIVSEDLKSSWQGHCADILFAFFDLFGHGITRDVIMHWLAQPSI